MCGVCLTWRAAPAVLQTISIRISLRKPRQFLVYFAFNPSGAFLAKDEVVRGVQHTESFSMGTFIIQLNRWRLVVVFQDVCVMLQLVYDRQFNAMALELDGHAHFLARIPAGHIAPTSSDTSRRVRGSHLSNRSLRSFRYRQPPKPHQ